MASLGFGMLGGLDVQRWVLPLPGRPQTADDLAGGTSFAGEARADWADLLTERVVLCVLRPRTPRPREALQSSRAKRILGQLRRYVLLSVVLSGLGVATIVSLVLRGSTALVASSTPECRGSMRQWLICFGPAAWLQGLAPLCVVMAALVRCESHHVGWAMVQHLWPLLSIFVFCWCASVAASVRPPKSCHAMDGLAYEMVALQCLSSCAVVTMDVCLLEAQPLLRKLSGILSGRAALEAATMISQLPGCEPRQDEECAICLGCNEDEEDPLRGAITDEGTDAETVATGPDSGRPPPTTRWVRLPCSHAFHRGCLFQWVTKARPAAAKQCPMCRSRFKEASRSSRHAPAAAAAGATAASSAGAPLLGGSPVLLREDCQPLSTDAAGVLAALTAP